MEKSNLSQQAQEILKMAEKHGIEQHYLFLTTFKRYTVQLKMLEELEKTMNGEGMVIEKQYIKGAKNRYAHPAISSYNHTADCANKTVSTLVKIITTLRKNNSEEVDPLLEFLSGKRENIS